MAIPGTPGVVYTADGLEHTEAGIPSSSARDHDAAARQARAQARAARLRRDGGPTSKATATLAVITFGSSTAAVREARRPRRATTGVASRLIALRLLAPAQPEQLDAALDGRDARARRRAEPRRAALPLSARRCTTCPGKPASFHRPGPLPLRPGELAKAIVDWARDEPTSEGGAHERHRYRPRCADRGDVQVGVQADLVPGCGDYLGALARSPRRWR